MKTLKFRTAIIAEPDGDGYHGYCREIKGIHVYGDTQEEAVSAAKDAIEVYLRMSIDHGDPIPIGIEQASINSEDQFGSLEDVELAFA